MEFILYAWVTVRSEILTAIFRKSMISGDDGLKRMSMLVFPIEISSGSQ